MLEAVTRRCALALVLAACEPPPEAPAEAPSTARTPERATSVAPARFGPRVL